MKLQDYKGQESRFNEDQAPYIRTFSSQEEADQYNMTQDIERSDIEKFRLFCRMMRIGRMLANAKIIK